ncbi:MAG TPA: hypothetical protein VHP37_33675 [Burkholderiales bacterium]|nr:hypothetical protein [Burkholderiales bacterium]
MTIHFCDGTKLCVDFPQQTTNEAAAQLRFDDVLKNRHILLQVEGTLFLVPFENIKYVQFHPAPDVVRGHTYITGAVLREPS